MRVTALPTRPARHPSPDMRLALWTAIAALAAIVMLGAALPTMATHLRVDRESPAPRPMITPLATSAAAPSATGRGDPSLPLSSEVFSKPRDGAGIEALPSTF